MTKIDMTAKKSFHNALVEGEDVQDGVIKAGAKFATNVNHAKDLQRLGLAEAEDADALDKAEAEPEPERAVAIAANRVKRTTELG